MGVHSLYFIYNMVFVNYWYSITYNIQVVVNTLGLGFTSFTEGRSRVFYIFNPHEGNRSVIPLDAASVNRTIFHYHSVH